MSYIRISDRIGNSIGRGIAYAELRCRSHFSFLRGASAPGELIERAAHLGYPAIAITDRDGVYGIPRAFYAKKAFPELKLITGAELTIEGRPHLSLLAIDRAGYGLMCRMLTASHEGKPKGKASLSWSTFVEMAQEKNSSGLIAIPECAEPQWAEDFGTLKDLFGDRVYLPLMRMLDGKDRKRTREALKLSQRLGIPIVATNDVHYHVKERRALQDVLVATRELSSLKDVGRKAFSNAERYLKSPEEMARLFHDLPEALANTVRIADRCRFSPSELRYRYPSEWIPAGETAQSYLEGLVWKGATRRYPSRGGAERSEEGGAERSDAIPGDVVSQLEHELALIAELQFADYFLTIWEIVEFARGRGILCQGRGSAANSAVCYCLGITAIDPVRMNLLFERFISVERGEPPDIDVDFEHERREEVIQHIYEKYGRDRAGMVAAAITYRTKSALRDVSKALGVGTEHPDVGPLVEEIKGVPRHLSIHSGGFTLSADPIIETVPIEPARMEGRTIVQWDKEDLAIIGLLKVDVLALGMLSALNRTFDLIAPREKLTIATIPPDDSRTYAMIQRAETVGVFQIESRAQMSMLGRLLPKTFYDLVVEVAIVRPGPIVGQMVHPYLRRRRGEEPIDYPDPRLIPILSRTLGVPLFQEQVMKIAIHLAGFTPGEADELRRAIGAWRSSGTLERMGRKLMKGLLESGLPPEFVERLFKQVQGFAEYGFPESHAASFALLAYASSYLKCHYPAEFTCALLNSQPMGFYAPHTLVEEAKRQGVRVLPMDPNISIWDCVMEDSALRIGLRVVNGLGEDDARALVAERERGSFTNLGNLLARVRLAPRVLLHLAMGDAFSCFGLTQREALWEILAYQNLLAGQASVERAGQQLSLFSGGEIEEQVPARFASLSEYQTIRADYQAYGLSVRGHPMKALRLMIGKRYRLSSATTTRTVKRTPMGSHARLAGLVIVRQRPPTAKGTCFATLEDEDGFLDLIIHQKVYDEYEEIFLKNSFLIVTGRVQRDANTVNFIVRRFEAVEVPVEAEPSAPIEAEPSAPIEAEPSAPKRAEVRAVARDFQ